MQDGYTKAKSSAQPLPIALRELARERRWVIWEWRERDGRMTKPPLQCSGKAASVRDPDTWCSHREAVAAIPANGGIGYVLGPDVRVGAIDIDKCRVEGRLVKAAQDIVDRSGGAYIEVTPSGEGIRVIGLVRGGEPVKKVVEQPLHCELYRGQHRYITISGQQISGGRELTHIDRLIDDIAGGVEEKKDKSTSGKFHAKVCKLFERSKDDAWIEDHIERHPGAWASTKAEVFIAQNRLLGEIERSREAWEKDHPQEELKKKVSALVPADQITPEDVNWEWYPFIASSEMFWIMSRGGVGKGLMCADLAARMTTENKWPLSHTRATKGRVYWFESEDSLKTTVVPRLIAAGADRSRVHLVERSPQTFFRLTRQELIDNDVGMIVLSPLLSYLDVENFRDEIQVRDALESMSDLIRDIPCTIVGLLHPNKKDGLEAVERILGSVAFANFVRSLVILRDEGGVVRMVHAKYNLSVKGDDHAFTKYNTEPKRHATGQYIAINWEKTKENADESTLLDRMTKTEKAVTAPGWLENFLGDGQWHTCDEIFKAAAEAKPSHREDALRQAKLRNDDIEHERRGFGGKLSWRLKKRRS